MGSFLKNHKEFVMCIFVFTVLFIFFFLQTKSLMENIDESIVSNNDSNDYKISSVSIILLAEKVDGVKEEYIIDNAQGVRQCIDNLNSIRVRKSVYRTNTYHNLNKENYIISFYDDERVISDVHIMRKDVVLRGNYYRINNYSKTMIQRFYEISVSYGMKK